jgi:hypothetical protein
MRGSVVLLALSIAVSGAFIGVSSYFWSNMDREYRQHNRALVSVRRKYQTIDEEEAIINAFLPRYESLETQGIVGRERRLDWIETLRESSQDLKLPSLRYAIETQTRHRPEFPVETGGFEIYASDMRLTLGLLHEEDLPRLFLELDANATGLYSVTGCDLRRSREDLSASPTDANVAAQCTIRWFTIRLPEGSAS